MTNAPQSGAIPALIDYAKRNKRWLLIPIGVVLALFIILLILAELLPMASPFTYTLF